MPSDEPLGEEIIAWIESECRVPEVALIGEPLQLMEWQRDAIRRTYDNPARPSYNFECDRAVRDFPL